MSEKEIKEILNNIKRQNKWKDMDYFKTPLSTEDADKLLDYIGELQQENQQLKDNWKELKRWLQEKADNETLILRLYLLGVLNAVEVIENLDKVKE